MSNYRVRQVLALGAMPERQLRFLIALATWMNDQTRTVRVGLDTLIKDTGNARNTVRSARRELESAGKLSSTVGRGKGHLTVWVVLCLPPSAGPGKDASDVDPFTAESEKGVNGHPQKGSTTAPKRGQPESADLREPDRGLNRRAKSLGFSLSQPASEADDADDERENDPDDEDIPDPDFELLAKAVPDADPRDVEDAITTLQYRKYRGEIRTTVRAYLRKIIENGDAQALVDDAAADRRRAKIEADRCGDPFGGSPDPWAPAPPFAGPVVVGEVVRDGHPAGTEADEAARLLAPVDPTVTADEAGEVLEVLRQEGARRPVAVLQTEIGNGNGYKRLGEARHRLDRQDIAQWDVGELAALPAADAPESRTSMADPYASPAPGWKQVECPVCKAPAGAFCRNPGTGGTAATHGQRHAAARSAAAQ